MIVKKYEKHDRQINTYNNNLSRCIEWKNDNEILFRANNVINMYSTFNFVNLL